MSMKTQATRAEERKAAIDALCPQCGLCCNGVLFGDVTLRKGDDPKRLQALDLPLARRGRKVCFLQPCACFDGRLCRIYGDRPVQCRKFACRVLLEVRSGRMTVAAGLRRIQKARQQAERVRTLLRRLGHRDESMGLTQRYSEVMAAPVDLSKGAAGAKRRGDLMMAVHDLMETATRDFLT